MKVKIEEIRSFLRFHQWLERLLKIICYHQNHVERLESLKSLEY